MEFREHDHDDYAGRGTTGLAATAAALGGVGTFGTLVELLRGIFPGKQCEKTDMTAALAALAPMIAQLVASPKTTSDLVNKGEFDLQNKITEKDMEISFLRGRDAAKSDTIETFSYINAQLTEIRAKQSEQDVKNAKIEGAFAVLGEKIEAQKNEFICALNRERDERCCSDNSIVNYANATFYPKLVAGVTPTTDTTPQTVYNPLPNNCGSGCR